MTNLTPAQRLMTKIIPEPNSGCWLWMGAVTGPPSNYGQFWHNGRVTTAHRASYEILVGPVSDDLVVDHLCRNRYCVNPRHLEPVTHRVNNLRGLQGQLREFCIRGHALTGDNVYIKPKMKSRVCITCRRLTKNYKKSAA